MRLDEVHGPLPAWAVEVYWCDSCRGFGKENLRVLKSAGDLRSALGNGKRLVFAHFDDYPDPQVAKEVCGAGAFDLGEYTRFLCQLRGRRAISKVGGWPSFNNHWPGVEDALRLADSGWKRSSETAGCRSSEAREI